MLYQQGGDASDLIAGLGTCTTAAIGNIELIGRDTIDVRTVVCGIGNHTGLGTIGNGGGSVRSTGVPIRPILGAQRRQTLITSRRAIEPRQVVPNGAGRTVSVGMLPASPDSSRTFHWRKSS